MARPRGGFRHVRGLLWARLATREAFPPPKGLKGTKQQGIAFQWAVGKAVPALIPGPWFHYADAYGEHFCQPDWLLPCAEGLVILECKRTDTLSAREQLRQLYFPVLAKAFQRPVFGIVVVKNVSRDTDRLLLRNTLGEAVQYCLSCAAIPTWHFPFPAPSHPSAILPDALRSLPGIATTFA